MLSLIESIQGCRWPFRTQVCTRVVGTTVDTSDACIARGMDITTVRSKGQLLWAKYLLIPRLTQQVGSFWKLKFFSLFFKTI